MAVGVAISTFLQGTTLIPLKEFIAIKQPITLDDLFARANRYVVQLDILRTCELAEHPEKGTRKRGRLISDRIKKVDGKVP